MADAAGRSGAGRGGPDDAGGPAITEQQLPQNLRNLILTPLKLRLEARQYAVYAASCYWSHALFFLLLLLKLEDRGRLPWALVFSPLVVGHVVCLINAVVFVSKGADFVRAQLGPPPPNTASTGIMILYRTMRKARIRGHVLDCTGAILDHLALLAVEIAICALLTTGRIADPTVCWRLVFLPIWLVWPMCVADYFLNHDGERHPGAMRMLFSCQALLIALKLDGVGAYSWSIAFIITWMWLGSLFVAGTVLLCMALLNGTCLKVKDVSTVLGFGIIMVSSSSMMPTFVFLSRLLEGFPDVSYLQVLLPQVLGWLGVWVGSVVVTYAVVTKSRMRALLASAGRVWTRHEDAARLLLAGDLESTQDMVAGMSDEALAHLAVKLMMGKARPTELMKVSSTLYRRVTQMTLQQSGAAVLRGKGAAAAAAEASGPRGDETGPALELKGRSSAAQEEVLASATTHDVEGVGYVQVQVLFGRTPSNVAADQGSSVQSSAASDVAGAQAALPPAASSDFSDDDDLCTICYDGPATCVLLECGHGGYCWRCAHILYMKPPNECPVCRRRIDLVVEVTDPQSQVGQPAAVRTRDLRRKRRLQALNCLRPPSTSV